MKRDHKTQPHPAEADLPAGGTPHSEEEQKEDQTKSSLKLEEEDGDREEMTQASTSYHHLVNVKKRKPSHLTAPHSKRSRRFSSPSESSARKTTELPTVASAQPNEPVSFKEDPPASPHAKSPELKGSSNATEAEEQENENMDLWMLDFNSPEPTDGKFNFCHFYFMKWKVTFFFISVKGLELAEEECREKMTQVGKDIQAAYSLLRKAKEEQQKTLQILTLQTQIDMMKEKLRLGAEEVAQLLKQKEKLLKKLTEASKRKMRSQIAVRMAECEDLHFCLQFIESPLTVVDRKAQEEAEEKARRARDEADLLEAQFKSLQSEYDNVAELLNVAQHSYDGTLDALNILQVDQDKLGEQLKNIQRLIRNYGVLEKKLAKINYLKTLNKVNLKVEGWMEDAVRFYNEDTS